MSRKFECTFDDLEFGHSQFGFILRTHDNEDDDEDLCEAEDRRYERFLKKNGFPGVRVVEGVIYLPE